MQKGRDQNLVKPNERDKKPGDHEWRPGVGAGSKPSFLASRCHSNFREEKFALPEPRRARMTTWQPAAICESSALTMARRRRRTRFRSWALPTYRGVIKPKIDGAPGVRSFTSGRRTLTRRNRPGFACPDVRTRRKCARFRRMRRRGRLIGRSGVWGGPEVAQDPVWRS